MQNGELFGQMNSKMTGIMHRFFFLICLLCFPALCFGQEGEEFNPARNDEKGAVLRFNVAVNGTVYGPYDLNTLSRMAAAGQLTERSQVWRQGMAAWQAAGTVPELAGIFAGTFVPAPSVPVPPGQTPGGSLTQPGLYAGNTFRGALGLLDALDWLTLNAQNEGNYTIVLGKDEAITPTELYYNGKTLTITLKSAGNSKRTVKFEGNSPSYSLFTVTAGVTFVLEEGITLSGTQNDADKSLVRVSGGRFIMNGGAITGNKTSGWGGGVSVISGAFTLNGGTIRENSAPKGNGGGVYANGTFTMNNGTISTNTASSRGGGVYADTFTKSGTAGIIYGSNNAEDGQANRAGNASSDSSGHAVYAGGKKRNTTARATTAMDSGKNGPTGGWE